MAGLSGFQVRGVTNQDYYLGVLNVNCSGDSKTLYIGMSPVNGINNKVSVSYFIIKRLNSNKTPIIAGQSSNANVPTIAGQASYTDVSTIAGQASNADVLIAGQA